MILDLDSLETLPTEALEVLSSTAAEIREEILEDNEHSRTWEGKLNPLPMYAYNRAKYSLARSLKGWRIRGHHCTKELHEGKIQDGGLRALDAQLHINEFLEYLSRSPDFCNYLEEFKSVLLPWLQDSQIRNRQNQIWFCLNKSLVIDNGCQYFFKYYGGEIVYWPIVDYNERLSSILTQIGQPIVVTATFPISDMHIANIDSISESIIRRYIWETVDPEFRLQDLETFLTRNVRRAEIECVQSYEVFRNNVQ
jgi:hypothetical protein